MSLAGVAQVGKGLMALSLILVACVAIGVAVTMFRAEEGPHLVATATRNDEKWVIGDDDVVREDVGAHKFFGVFQSVDETMLRPAFPDHSTHPISKVPLSPEEEEKEELDIGNRLDDAIKETILELRLYREEHAQLFARLTKRIHAFSSPLASMMFYARRQILAIQFKETGLVEDAKGRDFWRDRISVFSGLVDALEHNKEKIDMCSFERSWQGFVKIFPQFIGEGPHGLGEVDHYSKNMWPFVHELVVAWAATEDEKDTKSEL